MNEIKNLLIIIAFAVIWGFGWFVGGYLLSNRQAIKRLRDANLELAEQQQRYDKLIRESEERVREANKRVSDIRNELLGKVSDNGKTAEELTGIIEQIRRQKLNI